jgi:hypothetical protein
MLNNMIASFSASNQVGELMKKKGEKELQEEKKTSNYLKNQKLRNKKQKNRVLEFIKEA